jgi:3-hydroxy-9,10-secoandrosta-1,3,5(10)-triene-9,17-dione monooxygenase reductase component
MDSRPLRQALGRFATGVTIVSCHDTAGAFVGLTVNSFNTVSLQPPLVLWSLRCESPNLAAFMAATHFAVNVLAESQVELSRRFAARVADKFAVGAWKPGAYGAPLLAGCAAVFECETASQQLAGDHHLFIGRVLACTETDLAPLLFAAGNYHRLGPAL